MLQVLWIPITQWETWIELLALSFRLAQPGMLAGTGGLNQRMGNLCLAAFQINF